MRKLMYYLKNYIKECVLGVVFKFIEAALELLLPTIMALIINEGVLNRDQDFVMRMGGLMILLACLGWGSAMFAQYVASIASMGFGTAVRTAIFQKILKLSAAQVDKFGAPTMINRLTNDISQLQIWVAMLIRMLIRIPSILIGAIIMAMILNARLSLILIIMTPFIGLVIWFVMTKAAPLYKTFQQKLDRVALAVRENLAGVRVIRAFTKIGAEKRHFQEVNDDLMETGFKIGWVTSLFNPLTTLIVNLAIIAILWFGGIQISAGELSQGEIVAFINYVNLVLYSLIVLMTYLNLHTRASASSSRVNEILDTEPDMENPNGDDVPKGDKDAPVIRFSNVSFGYSQSGEHVLSDINIDIARGETIGLIGGTGAGKTTFINLIMRLYDVQEGAVYVNGVNVRDIPFEMLRSMIGIVPQQTLLFTGSIGENIRWGKDDADQVELERAADNAQASEFIINTTDGYDTPVQRGGVNFSGGQKQRLTIARAMITNPEILILDDFASAVDFQTESKLKKAIRDISEDMTVLIISQRVGAVMDADRILVFSDGGISAIGTHEQLLNDCAVYRDICLTQISVEEAGL